MNDLSDEKKRDDSREAREIFQQERRGLFWNLVSVLAGQGGTFLFGILAVAFTTRVLGADGYGRLALFFMVLNFFSDLLVHWPNTGVIRFGREELAREGKLSYTFWGRMFLLALMIAISAGLFWPIGKKVEMYIGLPDGGATTLLAYLALVCTLEALGHVLQVQGQFQFYGGLGASTKLLNAAFAAGLLLAGLYPASPLLVLRFHLISLGMVLLLAAWAIRWRQLLPPRFSWGRIAAMVRFSWPFIFSGISMFIVSWIDFAIIKAYWDRAVVGAYSLSYQCILITGGVRVAVLAVLAPFIMSLKIQQKLDSLRQYLEVLVPQGIWGSALLMCIVAMFGEALPHLCGREFEASVLPFQILTIGAIFQTFTMFYQGVINAFDRSRFVAYIGITTCFLNVVGDLWLVPMWGGLGAAVATSAAMAIANMLFIPCVNSIPELRTPRCWRRYLMVLGALPCLVLVGLCALTPQLGARVIVSAGVLIMTMYAVRWGGIFQREALDSIAQISMPRFVRRFFFAWYRVLGSGAQRFDTADMIR